MSKAKNRDEPEIWVEKTEEILRDGTRREVKAQYWDLNDPEILKSLPKRRFEFEKKERDQQDRGRATAKKRKRDRQKRDQAIAEFAVEIARGNVELRDNGKAVANAVVERWNRAWGERLAEATVYKILSQQNVLGRLGGG